MGVLNPLRVLDDGITGQSFKTSELISMARRNAETLERSFSQLLDLASIEGGAFHARLTDVDLAKLVPLRLALKKSQFTQSQMSPTVQAGPSPEAVIAADLGKLARVVDLCLDFSLRFGSTAAQPSSLNLALTSQGVEFRFTLPPQRPELLEAWGDTWLEARAGLQSRVASTGSAFGRLAVSEKQFLSRTQEGVGGELWLIHEIMRLHQGRVIEFAPRKSGECGLALEFPTPSGAERLKRALDAAVERVIQDLGEFSLLLARLPSGVPQSGPEQVQWTRQLRERALSRADLAVAIPGGIALLLESCAVTEQPWVIGRVERALNLKQPLIWAGVHVPTDVLDPTQILALAQRRLRER